MSCAAVPDSSLTKYVPNYLKCKDMQVIELGEGVKPINAPPFQDPNTFA